jgi:hypothetical protein
MTGLTYPQLDVLTAPVEDADVLAVYRAANARLRQTTASVVGTYARAPLALSSGAGLVGYLPPGVGAVAGTVGSALSGGYLLASTFGIVGGASGSATANVPKLQAAVDAASTLGKTLLLDVLDIWLDGNIVVPVGLADAVDIRGMGMNIGRVIFTGAAVTKGFTFEGPGGQSYAYCGSISELQIQGTSGALRATNYYDVNHPSLTRVLINGFAGCAVKMVDALMSKLDHCLFLGNGSATEYAIEISGASTTFMWLHSRISGGLAGGATTKIGGLAIDGVSGFTIIGGNIESTGLPIAICSKTEASRGCYGGVISGLGIENPGNDKPYIDAGQGWTGSPGGGVQSLTICGVTCTPSGTTTGLYGMRLKNTLSVEVDGASNFVPATSGATSIYNLDGANNFGFCVAPSRASFGFSFPYVVENGTWRKDATPYLAFVQDQITDGLAGTNTISGANPSILVDASQGGYYATLYPDNGGATTMVTLTNGVRNETVRLVSLNANTTIQHGTGASQFLTLGAADFLMTAGRPYNFWHNGTAWVQET